MNFRKGQLINVRPIRRRGREAGIALLIAIFVLLLISVVAIAVVVSSDTESHLTGNYRSSTEVYYAALAGVEEARARLRSNDSNSLKLKPNFAPFYPAPGNAIPIGTLGYILNPGPNDTLGNMLTAYPDTEYDSEFGSGTWGGATKVTTASITSQPLSGLPFPGPLYKWVRINAISEKSLNLDVDADGQADSVTPLYYDGTNPSNAHFSNNSAVAGQALPQALELTALAVLPNGTQKILQYVITANPMNLTFPAALTMDGNNVQFSVPTSTSFGVSGVDQGTVGNCNPSAAITAVGYTNAGDASRANIVSAIPTGPPPPGQDRRCNYTNGGPCGSPPAPNVGLVAPSVPQCPGCNLSTVAGLNALVQAITQSADVVISGNATQASLPGAMSATNPMTTVVNGNLTLSGWHGTGYGLLLVTGELTYDPDASWDGLILVIGTGKVYSYQGGAGQFLGAIFVAKTTDASGNPLPSGSALGSPFFDFTSGSGGSGIFYSSCWVQASQPTSGYRILSFHEISQ